MRAWPMTKKFRLFSSVLYFVTVLPIPAVAAVDITGRPQIEVSDWDSLKAAVENSANSGSVIILTQNIDANARFSTIADNIIVDGQGYSLNFNLNSPSLINISKNEQTDLILQNITVTGTRGYYGGSIINQGTIGDIHANFKNNSSLSAMYGAYGSAIYNYSTGKIGNITGDFISNYASSQFTNGGAILNDGTIGEISGNFMYNYATGGSNGGAIYNTGTIEKITGDFTQNHIKSYSGYFGDKFGGSLYNSGKIGIISSTFNGNYISSEKDSDELKGGAVYNASSLTFLNSNFYNNTITTTASKDSAEGKAIQGAGIYSSGLLTIKADAGSSIFSNNKIIWSDGEDSSAIAMSPDATLHLDTKNGGLIQFDDKITSSSSIADYLENAENRGDTITQDSAGNYIIEDSNGQVTHLTKTDGGYSYVVETTSGIPQTEANQFIQQAQSMGAIIEQVGNDYTIKYVGDGDIYNFTKQPDGTYTLMISMFFPENGASVIISGDTSSRVEFNEQLENMGTIDISGTIVNVNKGIFYRSLTQNGAILNIATGVSAEDSIVGNGGTMNIADGASINRTQINNGGVLNLATGSKATDTTVGNGGKLVAAPSSQLHNMFADNAAVLNIDKDSLLSGNIIIDANAVMGGSYDYGTIFKDEVADEGSLTLVGGINGILDENSLINQTSDKRLNLTNGSYEIGDGVQSVTGWEQLVIKDSASVKLSGDISLNGPAKKIFIENNSTLNLAGNSPSSYIITGSVMNDGTVTFSHATDGADDTTTIYGNYKAYNNAQMTVDVDPVLNVADVLHVDGDVIGTTKVTLNVLSTGLPTQKILFIEAPNDDLTTGAYFNIYRVYGNSYTWNALYENGNWYAGTSNLIPNGSPDGYGDGNTGNMADDPDLVLDAVLPTYFPSEPNGIGRPLPQTFAYVVPEAIAYMGLPAAGIEQTRDMLRNVSSKLSSTKINKDLCYSLHTCEYNSRTQTNAWITPVYSHVQLDMPYKFKANIGGLDGGFDLNADANNRFGVFGSYRYGNYKFDGDGKEYVSKTGSETEINSAVFGIYHRYEQNHLWLAGQAFLGYQDVSIETDDGVNAETDGFEFGGAIEAGITLNPALNFTIEPLARLAYTQIDYDKIKDEYEKTAKYSNVSNIETEFGIKAELTFPDYDGFTKIYIRPSIIHNIGDGDITVTSLTQVNGLEDGTFGRIEFGGSLNFYDHWSGYANIAYTFSDDYKNAFVTAGFTWAF